MNISFSPAPWHQGHATGPLAELSDALEGLWGEIAEDFYARFIAARNAGGRTPKGMQRTLNAEISRRLTAKGWEGTNGRFVKGDAWARISFRHQMSLGSDILDAIRAASVEKMSQCAVIVAPRTFLNLVTPDDAQTLCSYEKLNVKLRSLVGVTDAPIFAGLIEPMTPLRHDILEALGTRSTR